MYIEGTRISCGVVQATGLYGDLKANMLVIANYFYNNYRQRAAAAMVAFSDRAAEYSGGSMLANFIRENNLGALLETESKRNPNSGNMIKVWIFQPDTRRFKAWWRKNKPATAA